MNEIQVIQNKIYEIRGQRVMLDFDLATLYCVETRVLNQAVKRNIERFPPDFMFQITAEEWSFISSQFVMTSRLKRPKSALPLAFTEHGALMLASVLRSNIAIDMSVKITRAFVAMRTILTHPSLPSKLQELAEEVKTLRKEVNDILVDQNDINEDTRMQLELINESLAALQTNYRPPRRPIIGFNIPNDKDL